MGDARPGACLYHPGRAAAGERGGPSLCAECEQGRRAALARLEATLPRRDCLATRSPAGRWQAERAAASVHWLAHELGSKAIPGAPACLAGYPLRLDDLLVHRHELSPPMRLTPGALWVDLDREHCGLVVGVHRARELRVSIRHLCPQRGFVLLDDLYERFSGRGSFYL